MEQIRLGLKENWKQFTLLVIINGFVGGMAGLERSILPQIAEKEFAIAAKTAILSFIIVFGIVKAITNYYAGTLANKFGRKNLLIAGWIIGIPVPFILMFAPSWSWVIPANILLGINQGLAWSSTVVMKIDLVGEKDRGFAMGLNEFAGYIALAAVAFLTGWIAAALAVGHGGHGRYADFVQALDRPPLLACTEYRSLDGEQILDYLAPADTAVNLDEVAAPLDLGAQRAAAFQFAVDLAFEALDLREGILAPPQGLEGFGEDQLHGAPSAGRVTT